MRPCLHRLISGVVAAGVAAVAACAGTTVSPSTDASTSTEPPDAPLEARSTDGPTDALADAPLEARSTDGPTDAFADAPLEGTSQADASTPGLDALADVLPSIDATDSSFLAADACTGQPGDFPCLGIFSSPDAAAPSPTWDAASSTLTFQVSAGSWTAVSGTATVILFTGDGGTSSTKLPLVVHGAELDVDLASTLADPGVLSVAITQLVLLDACGDSVFAAIGGPGGTYFYVWIGRSPPYLTSTGCAINA
jgi:hypothetical protein